MKSFITILIMLVAVGCGKSLEEKVVGRYGHPHQKFVLLENGKVETYWNGPSSHWTDGGGTWKLVEKEVHLAGIRGENLTRVLKIEVNGDLTWIASIEDGKRKEAPKGQLTFKKVKE